MLRSFSVILLAAFALSAGSAERPYHLRLEASPSAAFPFLSKFGTVQIHVYGGGVRAETLWLNGFSRNSSRTLTVENPLGRMYTELPIAEISSLVRKLGGSSLGPISGPPEKVTAPVGGKVGGLDASRYRLYYGPQAWIDIWTTATIPQNPQFRAIALAFVEGISPPAADIAKRLPGTPVYVELNFRRFKKVPLLQLKSYTHENAGEADALSVGSIYFRAPLLESLWK